MSDITINDSMLNHLKSIDTRPDCIGQQLHACVADGKMYDDDKMRVIACILSGVDITEVFNSIRVNKMCKKFGLMIGDSFDLRTDTTCLMKQIKPMLFVGFARRIPRY